MLEKGVLLKTFDVQLVTHNGQVVGKDPHLWVAFRKKVLSDAD